jgi:hypothetical protein
VPASCTTLINRGKVPGVSMVHPVQDGVDMSVPVHCTACRAPLCRKMIVVEGVYANSGDVAPLQQLYRLKEAYK